MRTINKVILHCSASDNCDQTAAMIDKWHKERGWAKIGYHYFIRTDGMLEGGRPEAEVGAHCEGHNADSLGICLAGLSLDNFSQKQFETLKQLLAILKQRYPKASLRGHKEFNKHKTCPVFNYSEFVKVWNQKELPRTKEPNKWLSFLIGLFEKPRR